VTLAVLAAMVPNDANSAARLVLCSVSGILAVFVGRRKSRGESQVGNDAGTAAFADRIRARMADQPDVIPMSDELVERIAGVLSPVPPAVSARHRQRVGAHRS
jgi:hypothetical protein